MCLHPVLISVDFLFNKFSVNSKFAYSSLCLHPQIFYSKNKPLLQKTACLYADFPNSNKLHANVSSSGNKTKEQSFAKRKEPTMAKQRAKYGKLNICQADGWHYHSTFRLTILLEKVINSSILLLCTCFFYLLG